MATNEHIKTVETVIGYTFNHKWLISQALTVAGAEENNYDGNRKLSQLGASLVDTILAILVYNTGLNRAYTTKLRQLFLDRNHYVAAAKRTKIDQCIKRNVRNADVSPEVHRKSINAIVAAVLLDNFNMKTVIMAMLRIFMTQDNDLRLLANDAFFEETLCEVLGGVMAREIGTINPAILPGRSAVYPKGYPIVYNLFHQDSITPPVPVNVSPQNSCLTPESELFEQFINHDMLLASPDPSFGATEGITEDALLFSTQEAPHFIPFPASVPEGNRQTPQGTKISRLRRTSTRAMIDEFLAQERQKCKDERLLSEHIYFTESIQNVEFRFNESLALLFATIAAPQQIAGLRDIICNSRVENNLRRYSLGGEISPKERVKLIFELDERVTGFLLVRWYHLVALFETCGGPETRSTTGFINNTSDTFQPQRSGLYGNPANKDDANVAQAMMDETYPNLQPGTDEYRKMQATFKKLRRLGKRLHMLVERFGQGILGLMLPSEATGTLPENKFLAIKESDFRDFVKVLDDFQGHILRQFSDVVFPPLWALLHGRLEEEAPFPLEKVDRESILASVKGSPDLFRLIS